VRNSLRCFVLLILVSSQMAASAQEWQRYSDEQGRFSVEMPTKPQTQSTRQKIVGGELVYHFYISQLAGGDQVFMVSRNDYPAENLKATDTQTLLDACVNGAVKSRQGKLLTEENVKLNGYPGRSITFSGTADSQPLMVWHHCYFAENRLFQVMVMAKKNNQPTPRQISRFLSSFKIQKPE